jgi:outer membrane protein assembly factor BamB
MKYFLTLAAVLGLLLTVTATVEADAKGGKIRWSSNPDIKNGKPAIKVPAAQDGKPGIVDLKVVYVANKLAEFVLIGDGDTDIDVYVFDAKGQEVAKDVDPEAYGSDLCVCRWTPTVEQEFTIRIVNHGKVYNLCQAGTN